MNTLTEKKVSHTPGPWRTSSTYAMVETAKLKICEVHVNENVSENEFDFEQWRANAKLIAAAPELLAALKDLVQYLPSVFDPEEVNDLPVLLENAKSALAKATALQNS
jgi:hypothetical protein